MLALLLAALGLYGVTSYAVSRRRSEIGLRMALGAAPSGVVGLVLGRVALLVGLGVVAGLGTSLWASTFVTPLLYGLQPRDPTTLLGAAIVLTAIGAVAGWIPAMRAARIDPARGTTRWLMVQEVQTGSKGSGGSGGSSVSNLLNLYS